MPIHLIKPNAAFSDTGGLLTLNDYTELREGTASADSVPGLRTDTNDIGNTTVALCSTTDNMPETPTSLNSVTFRARGQFVNWSDDVAIYRIYANVPSLGSYQLSWAQNNYGNSGWVTLSVVMSTALTLTQLNGITFSIHQYQYGRNMGGDGVYFEVDCMEVEVDYSTSNPRNVTCSTEVITLTTNEASIFDRDVIGTTEAITVSTNNATVTKNLVTTIIGSSVSVKRKKGLVFQEHYFDAANYVKSNTGADSTNAWDGNIGTYAETNWAGTNGVGAEYAMGRGMSAQVGPIETTTEKPIRVEARFYVSNTVAGTGEIELYAYFGDDTYFNFDGDSTDEFFKTKGQHPVIAYGSVGGSWSPWAEVQTGEYGWDDPHNNNITEPLTWDGIKNELSFGFGRINGGTGRVHAIQVRITSADATLRTGYFDGSGTLDGGVTTVGNQWSNVANAYDGTDTTWATNSGLIENATLRVHGNTLTQGSADDEIYAVYVRARLRYTWTSTDYAHARIKATFHDLGDIDNLTFAEDYEVFQEQLGGYTVNVNVISNNNIVEVPTSGSPFWTPWYRIDNVANFTEYLNWSDLSKMSLAFERDASYNHADTELAVSRMEVAVLAPPTNANRTGGRAKKDRTLKCSTIAIIVTTNDATVDRGRGVLGETEVITLTESAATVSFAAPRIVNCSSTSIVLTTNDAVVNKLRNVAGVTEVITLTANPADVHAFIDRLVLADTEVITVTTNNASVNKTRGVVCVTEEVTVTPNNAIVTRTAPRNVEGATEVILLSTTPAITNTERIVLGDTEVITLSENTAAIIRNRLVSCSTEVITLTTNDASLNASRSVISTTEQITLTENTATITRDRVVSGATEVITFTTNPATVTALIPRNVVCSTEIITLTANAGFINTRRVVGGTVEFIQVVNQDANVNTERGVIGSVEQIAFVPSNSLVSTTREVVCSTEVITLSTNNANVSTDRQVSGDTEVITLIEGTANVATDRGVTGQTEVITITANAAQVFRGANRVVTCQTEVITLTTNSATVAADRNVAGVTEVVTVTTNNATIVFNLKREVNCSTEVITLTANDATIITFTDRDVVCSTEVITLTTNNATVETSANRIVTGATEVITLGANNAQIERSRSVNADTEVISLSTQDSNIGLQRGVSGTTEAILFTETNAGVNLSRNVQGQTAAITITVNPATLIAPRDVVGLTEVVSVVTNQATVNRAITIVCATEQITFSANGAQVFTGQNRFVNGQTEVILLTPSDASVSASFELIASTEVIELFANTATVSKVRSVAGTTEVINLATSSASINRSRSVVCDTEVINLIASPANVNRTSNLDVVGITEQVEITVNPAVVTFPRRVVGLTEEVSFTTNSASVFLDKFVVCETEVITLTANQANVAKKLSGVIPGYSLTYLRPKPEYLILWREE